MNNDNLKSAYDSLQKKELEQRKTIKQMSERIKELEALVSKNESLHLVSHTVIYDNFGRDWREPKEKYQIMEVLKDGYLIGNEYTKPFFAYEYQIKTCG